MDYTRLSIDDIGTALDAAADDARATFGGLDARALNWKPDATRWSVAQCLEHVLTANRLMVSAVDAAMRGSADRTLWRRLPFWPGVVGPMLIRSQAPGGSRTFVAPPTARPSTSDISGDVVVRFAEQQCDLARWCRALDRQAARDTIMTSPFLRLATYSVLDGCRLIVAHDHRHIEQAMRVIQHRGSLDSRVVG